jgi:hypothetical protein
VLVDAILKKLLVLEWYDIGYNHFSTDSDAGLAGVRDLSRDIADLPPNVTSTP